MCSVGDSSLLVVLLGRRRFNDGAVSEVHIFIDKHGVPVVSALVLEVSEEKRLRALVLVDLPVTNHETVVLDVSEDLIFGLGDELLEELLLPLAPVATEVAIFVVISAIIVTGANISLIALVITFISSAFGLVLGEVVHEAVGVGLNAHGA